MTKPALDDRPLTLADAAETFGLTVAALRAEHARGRLSIYKIGKRHYTTQADIREMVELCRVEQKGQGFTVTRRAASTSSATAAASLDSAHQAMLKLRNTSRTTSLESIGQRLAKMGR